MTFILTEYVPSCGTSGGIFKQLYKVYSGGFNEVGSTLLLLAFPHWANHFYGDFLPRVMDGDGLFVLKTFDFLYFSIRRICKHFEERKTTQKRKCANVHLKCISKRNKRES